MPFDSGFKTVLEDESRKAGLSEERAVFTNYYRDDRIPDLRAAECSQFVLAKLPEKVFDSLDEYTKVAIRQSRSGGFAGSGNNSNTLGVSGGLLGRRPDCEYARVLNLTSFGFYNALVDGAQYSVRKGKAVPSEFLSIFGAGNPTGADKPKGFQNFCDWLRDVAITSRPPFPVELEQVFLAHGAYIEALEDPDETMVKPYEPAWITPWESARYYGLDPEKVDTWGLALGVRHVLHPGEPPKVFALLKYCVPSAYRLYRPTCLEAGCYALHYPTHCGMGTIQVAESGHTMDCAPTAGSPPLREWIHLNCALQSVDLMALQLCGTQFPDLESNLEPWRKRHYHKLSAEYPSTLVPTADYIG